MECKFNIDFYPVVKANGTFEEDKEATFSDSVDDENAWFFKENYSANWTVMATFQSPSDGSFMTM